MTSTVRSSGDILDGLSAVKRAAGDMALQAARFIVSLNSHDFTSVDNAAEEMFGTESEEKMEECVALMSLWQHAYVLNPKMFSYLRCLQDADRSQLQRLMITLLINNYSDPQERRRRILSGYLISRSDWDQLMRSIPLSVTYIVWRYATWDELGLPPLGNSQAISRYHTRDRTFSADMQRWSTYHLFLDGRSSDETLHVKAISGPTILPRRHTQWGTRVEGSFWMTDGHDESHVDRADRDGRSGSEGHHRLDENSRNGVHGRRVYDGHGGYGVRGRYRDYNIGDEVVTEEVPTAVAVLEVVVPEAVTVVVMRD